MNRWLDRLEEGACVVLLAVMTGVAFINVVTRYLVRYSLAFTEEIVVNYEPTDGRITSCYRCHYTKGYIGAIESGTPFEKFRYDASALPEIPKDTPNVSCSVCHDSHSASAENPFGLRTGTSGKACDTCHYEKWQNAILEGMTGEIGNGYHYPGQDYSAYEGENNPQRREDNCVRCHMSTSVADKDAQQVRKVGGHTLRMRDYGDDLIPGTADDTLNIPVCQNCHAGLTTFDRNGVQTQVPDRCRQ